MQYLSKPQWHFFTEIEQKVLNLYGTKKTPHSQSNPKNKDVSHTLISNYPTIKTEWHWQKHTHTQINGTEIHQTQIIPYDLTYILRCE